MATMRLAPQSPAPSPQKEKAAPHWDTAKPSQKAVILLDLAFFIFNVLARNGIIFTHNHFLGHGPRVFLCHIEMACPRRRVQTDFDRCWLRHGVSLLRQALPDPGRS
jgi:hypothetical protein